MKKKVMSFFMAMCILLCASSMACAAGPNYSAVDKVARRGMDLIKSLERLGDQIVANNKHAFEVQLTRSEREVFDDEISSVMWNRVWAKDKTIVTGESGRNKKFYATSLVTADPKMVFAGGIHVGASTEVLEKFFNAPLREIAYRPGVIYNPAESDYDAESFYIFYDGNGRITEIYARWGIFGPRSTRRDNFIKKTRQQLGFMNQDFKLIDW